MKAHLSVEHQGGSLSACEYTLTSRLLALCAPISLTDDPTTSSIDVSVKEARLAVSGGPTSCGLAIRTVRKVSHADPAAGPHWGGPDSV
jgi:hypothetical protein